jgi:hypothetical protein
MNHSSPSQCEESSGALAWLVSLFPSDNPSSLSSLWLSELSNSASVLVFVPSSIGPIAFFNLFAILVARLSDPSSLGRLACLNVCTGCGHHFALFLLFKSTPWTSRGSVSPQGSPPHVGCGVTMLLLKLATNGTTGPMVNWEGVLDFSLIEIWDETVGGTAFKWALDVFSRSALLCSSWMWVEWITHSDLARSGICAETLPCN